MRRFLGAGAVLLTGLLAAAGSARSQPTSVTSYTYTTPSERVSVTIARAPLSGTVGTSGWAYAPSAGLGSGSDSSLSSDLARRLAALRTTSSPLSRPLATPSYTPYPSSLTRPLLSTGGGSSCADLLRTCDRIDARLDSIDATVDRIGAKLDALIEAGRTGPSTRAPLLPVSLPTASERRIEELVRQLSR